MRSAILSVGECMIEFFRRADGNWVQGFAGDTLNTAWAMRALLPESQEVSYVTRIGRDGFSDQLLTFLNDAGIGTGLIKRDGERQLGLYSIETDDKGERTFSYWRSVSAARHLADDKETLDQAFAKARLVYLSGITLAVLTRTGRSNLMDALGQRGQRDFEVAFDPNIRPALWEDAGTMCGAITAAAEKADIVLPTHDDEATAFGDSDAGATLARYRALGPKTVIVKNGAEPTLCSDGATQHQLAITNPVSPLDTTGAGDAFNGAFLAELLQNRSLTDAARTAQSVSAMVIGQRGALASPDDIKTAARKRS